MLRFVSILMLLFHTLSFADNVKPNDYSDPATWICKPDRDDACNVDLTATVIAEDGKTTKENWIANPKAQIDCFYVYPTISRQKTAYANMDLDPIERAAVKVHLARFGSQCRLFAPLYRQRTVTALLAEMDGHPMKAGQVNSYQDVADAWKYYIAHDNNGRGFVLIGHSLGTAMLKQLIQNQIEGKTIQKQMVSAILLGGDVMVPKGKDVGGTFKTIPLCHSPKQIGCVVNYSSYRSNTPPQSTKPGNGLVKACTNPSSLSGGNGELISYFGATRENSVGQDFAAEPHWLSPEKKIDTPFVRLPHFLSAECASYTGGEYLSVTIHADPKGPRATDFPGDLIRNGKALTDWGLHIVDMELAIGNLVDIVAQQAKEFSAARH